MTDSFTPEGLVRHFEAGQLAHVLARELGPRGGAQLISVEQQLVALHREGRISLLGLASPEAIAAMEGPLFFSFSHALGRLIPFLDDEPQVVMDVVERLVDKGGADLAANQPFVAFRQWLSTRQAIALDIIRAADEADALASRFIRLALESIGNVEEARRIAGAFSDDRRREAVSALATMPDDAAGYASSLALIEDILLDADDVLAATILRAAATIWQRADDAVRDKAEAVISSASLGEGLHVRHALVFALKDTQGLQARPGTVGWLNTVAKTPSTHCGTLDAVTGLLVSLAGSGKALLAARLVEGLVTRHDDPVDAAVAEEFVGMLDAIALSTVAVAWLLRADPALCNLAAGYLQSDLERKVPKLEIDDAMLPDGDRDLVFLARKAVGWLIMAPLDATLVVLACLRKASGKAQRTLLELLGNVLVLSYGSVRDYLAGLVGNGTAPAGIEGLLAQQASYVEKLRSVPDIRELKPSLEHQRARRVHERREGRQMAREVRARSVFASLVSTTHLLYGSGAVLATRDPDGSTRLMDMPMHSVGITMEVPQQSCTDPAGFDQMLAVLRMEEPSR